MTAPVSTVPAVLAALLNLATTAAGSSAGVVDGQPLPNQFGDFIAVGWNNDAPAVVVDQMPADAGMVANRETYTVYSQIVTWGGDADQVAVRTRAYALLNSVEAGLLADCHLGGACALARMSVHSYQPLQTDKGAMVELTFAVAVQAWKEAA